MKKAQQSVACGTTHARKGRDGVAAGHRAAVLSAGSGAVERIRRLPDGYQRVAQLLSCDAFHHHHGTGAEGTRRVAGSSGGPTDAWLHAEQRAAALERSSTAAVGEEAEVADADQAFGQDMDEKAAQELLGGNGHDLVLAAVGIVSPAEGDAMVLARHEAMVGDGDAMGIAGQVVENMFSTAEGWLGVNDPVLSAELPEEMVEAAG